MTSPNTLTPGMGGSGGIDFAPTSEYIGMALQESYNWVNNSVIYNTVPPMLRPFYRKVQNWERWINGYVPEFHDFDKGVLPTHLAKAIVDKVSALIFGGGLMLQSVGDRNDETDDGQSETLEFIADWQRRNAFSSVVQSVIRDAVGLGTSAFKLNADSEKELWVESIPLSRSRFSMNAKGEVIAAQVFLRIFERGTDLRGESFGLCEERFYDNNAPYTVYKMYKLSMPVNQGQMPTETYLSWEELPHWVRKQLKDAYYSIRLDERIRLPLTGIGIYPYRYTPRLSSMPHLQYGDSVLEGLQKYLCEYDIISACLDTEMYVSRARVLAKKNVQNPKKANYNTGLDSFIMTYYEEMGNESKPLTFIQPEVRAEQFRSLRNTVLENISTTVGISPSSFATYLQDASNRTAREVSAEESSTTLMVENKREGLLYAINTLLDDVRRYYAKPDSVRGVFSKAGQTNYTLLVENATRVYQAGGSSLEQFVRTVNPGMDEAQIKREIKLIREQEREREASRANSMFGDMEFGTNIKDNDDEV